MFVTFQTPIALLRGRCRDMTNVRTFLPHNPTFCTLILQNVHNALCISVKKSTQPDVAKADKGPRTEQDERFLTLVAQIMKAEHISSERAFSLEFGRGPDFISRIRRGIQSAPADAWDALLKKYPETRSITTTNVMAQGGGQAVGTVHGDNHYTLNDCERERDAYKGEVEQLRLQLAAKDDIIAAKDALIASQAETLSLLRGGYTRPN